jgi:23S rRNA G2069 N7-methylase RlmK/C1962 C5-methylase RlmI
VFKSIAEISLIQLKKGSSELYRAGMPKISGSDIHKIEGNPNSGDIVVVSDSNGKSIGWGPYNAEGFTPVRLLAMESENLDGFDLEHLLDIRISEAASLRQIMRLPSQNTNAYRLINSEGDRLSGLIVDVYGNVVVIFSEASWTEIHRKTIENAIQKHLKPEMIIWRPMAGELIQDGWESFNQNENGHFEGVIIKELGLNYKVALGSGQKTGYYCDHRENRALIRELARGRRVMDAFCYTGGFALNASIGGAQKVVGIDSSESAIELAQENARLNQINDVSFNRMEALTALNGAHGFDLIILDPPKLAPSVKELDAAISHYKHLNREAIKALPTDGLLFTASCSAALGMDRFTEVLRQAANEAERRISILKSSGTGPDYPTHPSYPEGNYLTCLLVCVL